MFNPKTECSGAQCALLLHPAAHSTVNWAKSTWDGGATESYIVHPFASRHEGHGFNPQGGTYVKPGFSC